jgi:AcrR family transcriptional regulator
MVERTGAGDPVRVIPLLWRQGLRTGRTGLTLDDVLRAATSLADRHGIGPLSMRRLAEDLGVGTMTIYAHVPGRGELIDLMVDQVHDEVRYAGSTRSVDWRRAVGEIAEANWTLFANHPWLLDVDTARPPLGPGTIAKYDAELRALAGAGLTDVETDQVLTLLLEHVKASARLSRSRGDESESDAAWWDRAGPLLAAFMDPDEYPDAARVGEAAGQEYGAASDPHRGYAFGLSTILDGVAVLIERRG